MDPCFLDQTPDCSQYSRSRPSSRASVIRTDFQTLEVTADDLRRIDQGSVYSRSKSQHSRSTSEQSNPYLSPVSQVPSTFVSAPTPPSQLYSPHPLLSEPAVDSDWSLFASAGPSEPHCVIVDPAEDMSILGVHYVSQFKAGSRPSSCPWSALGLGAMDNQYQNQHFGPMRNYGESRGTTAFPAPSLSPSPPRNMVLTEQRELKRLHDAARRNSKNRMRRETSENASSYTTSIVNTPEMIPGSLVSYTSSIPPLSLAAEVSSNVLPQGYIAPYQASYPQSMRSNSGHEIFNSGFSIPPSSYSLENYQIHYDASGNNSSQTVYPNPRQTPLTATTTTTTITELPNLYQQTSHTPHPPAIQTIHLNNQQPSQQHSQNQNQNQPTSPIRIVQTRAKPQCWDHGCNGRQFSTFSNLLRHQREKSGVASKSVCPKCGAEFTRTTARNGHMAHEKCRLRGE